MTIESWRFESECYSCAKVTILASLRAMVRDLEAEIAAFEANLEDTEALKAEVERLRAELAATEKLRADGVAYWVTKETAANALLERCDEYGLGSDAQLKADVRAHLAGQPAATRQCVDCGRERCECLEKDCGKCHWTGSPNCRGASRVGGDMGGAK